MFKNPLTFWSLNLAGACLLAGCATPQAPRPIGAVVPMEGGRYQSSVKGPDTMRAMKTFTHDAEAC